MFLIISISTIWALSAQMTEATRDSIRSNISNMGMMDKTPMSKGCCGPRRLTANIRLVGATEKPGGLPKITDSMAVLDYDFDLEMERLQMKNRDINTGKISMVDYFIDYKNSKTFSVMNGLCYVTPMASEITNHCLAANATFMGSYTLGSGDKTIMIESWSQTIAGQTAHLQVQPETCQTVSMTFYGTAKGAQGLASYTYLSVKPNTLSQSDTFTIPDSCKAAVSVPVGK